MYRRLSKHFSLLPFVWVLVLLGCNHTVDDIEVVRNPAVTLNINGEAWSPASIVVVGFGKDLVYETDTSTQGTLYFGYSLILTGGNERGLSRKITLRFAVPEQDQLRGRYTPQLTDRGVITRVEVLEQLTKEQYALYKLAPSQSAAFLQIDRQSSEKRLIAGSFAFTVASEDQAQQIMAENGVFTDISYQKWQNSNL